jgi:hypothetical protein
VPEGVQSLLNEARVDVTEILQNLPVSRAQALTQRTKISFETKQFPMYFTGAIEAPLRLVHLNPKLSARMDDQGYSTFDEYVDGHRRFGQLHWGEDPTYRSAFDRKQVRFLRPFSVRIAPTPLELSTRSSSSSSSLTPRRTSRRAGSPWRI